jgi:spore photoproduct lyase
MESIIEKIRFIYIEKDIKKHPLVERFISVFPSVEISYIDSYTHLPQNNLSIKEKIISAKKSLILAENRGNFIKKFYLHPSLKGRSLFSINHAIGCLFDCQYCYLQAYQDYPAFIQFVNLEKISIEVEEVIRCSDDNQFFFSSGILSDSLLFDELTGLCAALFPLFAAYNNAVLEIRSRTTSISHLLHDYMEKKNIVLSWSLSPEEITKSYEPHTPSAIKRIKAAHLCQKDGFNIGFHLDPLIHYPDWEKGYKELINSMKNHLSVKSIQYIFLGSFRFKQSWAKIFRKRFSASDLLLNEFVLSADSKFRYFKPIRLEMYRKITELLEKWNTNIPIYLAMEPPEVWKKWEKSRTKQKLNNL